MIHDGKKIMDWKNYNKKFNQQIIMDFTLEMLMPWSSFIWMFIHVPNF